MLYFLLTPSKQIITTTNFCSALKPPFKSWRWMKVSVCVCVNLDLVEEKALLQPFILPSLKFNPIILLLRR